MFSFVSEDVQRQESVLVLVIDQKKIESMQHADPLVMASAARGQRRLPRIHYPNNMRVIVAIEEENPELYKLMEQNDNGKLVEYLERGKKLRGKG